MQIKHKKIGLFLPKLADQEIYPYICSQKIVGIMEYTALLEKQILGRLKIDNPWWTEGRIPSYYQEMSPRLYLDIFYPLVRDVSIQRALILMGPRRVVSGSAFIPCIIQKKQ